MSDKTIVFITGGNTGIGLEVVKALCRSNRKYHIIVGTRTLSKGEIAVDDVKKEHPNTSSSLETVQADYSSDDSLQQAVDTIGSKHGRVDVLINNGGANYDMMISKGEVSVREGYRLSWDTNVTGPHILTQIAMPLLLKSADPRLLFVTSGAASLEETTNLSDPIRQRLNASPEKGWPKQGISSAAGSYRSSKTGLNMLMREWVKILKNDGVKIWAISPGFLATGLAGVGADTLRKMGAGDPSIGGEFMVKVVEGERDHDVGKVIRPDSIQPW